MAKIPLRAYLKEIENLIERGEIEQAIAHGKNILRAYPKHIETYRLLGKAFLESQRYSEASDILQRVLSVVPDDFVSQIGMSIIREDEGNMDAAIWHMERAYEVQPFNPAVQDELRRLYGRRDGIEPPKIRLTRGALVRMYARGELYPQAIAETRAALAEDAQRLDLRVLLARLYYLSGQKNDAAEVCSELIAKLPYCYEANRLLAEILPTTSRAEETPKFQQRIYALDPYEAFVSPSAPTSQQVPDQAVMVEQFLWEPGAEASQVPEWTRTVGVTWEEPEEENIPDWLNTLKPETTASPQRPAQPAQQQEQPLSTSGSTEQEDDLVPDWMKEAGWAASDRSAEEIMAEQGDATEEEIRPAEIPDWLQSIAPPQAVQAESEEEERTEWLESIFSPPAGENGKEPGQVPPQAVESLEAAQPTEEAPDWLSGLEQAGQTQEPEVSDLPDWLSQAQEEAQAAPTEELPDWSKLGEAASEEPAAAADDTPDWLKAFGSETGVPAASEEGLPDWMMPGETQAPTEAAAPAEPLASEEPAAFEASAAPMDAAETPADFEALFDAVEPEEVQAAGDVPDWLSSLGADMDQPEAPAVSAAPETERTVDAAMFGAVQSEPEQEQAEANAANTPDWLDRAPEAPVQEAAPIQSTDFPAQPDLSDIDATMAWLEALAARQGADEATLITPPDQRTDSMPDWVQKEVDEERPMAQAESVAQEVPVEQEQQAVPDFLEFESALPETPTVVEPSTEEPVELFAAQEPAATDGEAIAPIEEAELPDWLAEIGQPEEAAQTTQPEAASQMAETMPDLNDEAAALAWLESLAARQGADEATLITAPEERIDTPPDWVKKEMEEQPALEQEFPEPDSEVDTTTNAEAFASLEAANTEEPADALELADRVELVHEEAPGETELPDWLRGVEGISSSEPEMEQAESLSQELPAQSQPEMEAPVQAAPEIAAPAQAEAAMPDFSDMDAAMAWLESLAARQGADEATLVTPPDQRTDTMPDWVQKEAEAEQTEQTFPADVVPETLPAEENIPGWLGEETQELPAVAKSSAESTEEVETPAIAETAVPEILLPAEEPEPVVGQTFTAPEDLYHEEQETEAQAQETESASWLSEIEPTVTAEADRPQEAAPDWLQGLEEETSVAPVSDEPIQWGTDLESTPAGDEELPDWLKPADTEAQPTGASGELEEFPEWLMGLEEEAGADSGLPEGHAAASTGEYRAAWEPEIAGEDEYVVPPVEVTPQPVQIAQTPSNLLEMQSALNRGDLDMALDGYSRFIQNDEHLEEVIHDLRDALYRFPVDISIWQTLGDAYARNNQLQEALDAYTKAEELLR